MLSGAAEISDNGTLAQSGDESVVVSSLRRTLAHERAARIRAERLLDSKSQQLQQTIDDLHRSAAAVEEAREMLLHAEKMATVGQLAAGIAHEVNNPMAFVNSNLGMLYEYVDTFTEVVRAHEEYIRLTREHADDDAKNMLEWIEAMARKVDLPLIMEDSLHVIEECRMGARRVTEIVQNLRNFSRVDTGDIVEADLNETLAAAVKIAMPEIRRHAELHQEPTALPPLRCMPGPLTQVIVNLLVNAAQATRSPDGKVTVSSSTDAHWLRIAVSDNGTGIDAATRSKLFTPFFTTKPVGQGTGLGLSTSYAIVRKHGGYIDVESQPGTGSTFTVRLPLCGMSSSAEALTT